MTKISKFIFLLFASISITGLADELPDDSIYHINSKWLNQDSNSVAIGDFREKIQVVSFIYTYCEHSCPVIISTLKELELSLSEDSKNEVNFLLISLDPKRDTPPVLSAYMQERDLSRNNWTMLQGTPDDVLEMSALLGVRYRPMDSEGNDLAHSNMITVLDKEGRINYQMRGLNEDLREVTRSIESIQRGAPN